MTTVIEDMKLALEREGYTVVKNRTYNRMRERALIAEQELVWERRATENASQWGRDAHAELRRIEERLTLVYGEARAAGLTVEQLASPDLRQERCAIKDGCRLPAGHGGDRCNTFDPDGHP